MPFSAEIRLIFKKELFKKYPRAIHFYINLLLDYTFGEKTYKELIEEYKGFYTLQTLRSIEKALREENLIEIKKRGKSRKIAPKNTFNHNTNDNNLDAKNMPENPSIYTAPTTRNNNVIFSRNDNIKFNHNTNDNNLDAKNMPENPSIYTAPTTRNNNVIFSRNDNIKNSKQYEFNEIKNTQELLNNQPLKTKHRTAKDARFWVEYKQNEEIVDQTADKSKKVCYNYNNQYPRKSDLLKQDSCSDLVRPAKPSINFASALAEIRSNPELKEAYNDKVYQSKRSCGEQTLINISQDIGSEFRASYCPREFFTDDEIKRYTLLENQVFAYINSKLFEKIPLGTNENLWLVYEASFFSDITEIEEFRCVVDYAFNFTPEIPPRTALVEQGHDIITRLRKAQNGPLKGLRRPNFEIDLKEYIEREIEKHESGLKCDGLVLSTFIK